MTKPLSPIPEPQLPAARERVVEALTQHFANDSLSETVGRARLGFAEAYLPGPDPT